MFDILKKQRSIENISVFDIKANPFQPRRVFDEDELYKLGESIKENGLIQPISVRKTKNGYELIAGERRLRACRLIGKEKIDAIVYEIRDEDSAVWALIENLQRSDLGIFDEAEAILKLIKQWDVPREEAAKRLGIASSTLSNKLRLLKIGDDVRNIINEKNLTERHARELLRIEDSAETKKAAEYIAAKGLSVAESERYITKLLEAKKEKRKPAKYIVKDLRLFINTFEKAVEVMNSAGLCAVSTVKESGEHIIYSVAVPKSKAFRRAEKTAD